MVSNQDLALALAPIVERVRTDATCIKKNGMMAWTRDPLTPARLISHLKSEVGRGVCPIKAGENTTRVALLDLDSHKGETTWAGMLKAAEDIMFGCSMVGLEGIPFISSGGRGIHIYFIWDKPQDAYSIRRLLVETLEPMGFKNNAKGVAQGGVEVFPKQDAVAADGFGNQFILPLTGKSAPLFFDELAGLVSMPREFSTELKWPLSASVQKMEKPPRAEIAVLDVDLKQLKEALDAIPNNEDKELDYDQWRNAIFAIHSATSGSDSGLSLAHEFSARSSKYDAGFLDERVWPYISDRDGGISARTIFAMAREHGWQEDVTDQFDALPPLDEKDLAASARKRNQIPQAEHLTTDQANALRIVTRFKSRLIVANDRWYAWSGTHWAQDDSAVYACAFKLSKIIKAEAEGWTNKLTSESTDEEIEKAHGIADALDKWAKRSEMRATIDSALYLAKRMLAITEGKLDRDPWALNCLNGTVDLRTGTLKPHDPEDYITRCIEIAFDPNATAPTFEAVLQRVTLEDKEPNKPICGFLKRWFGYCATADTREQKFVVHYGNGSNGKSTILDAINNVMGEYAGTAAPGLVTAANHNNERHPTEVAALFGKRMITAHESEDGSMLREGFIKWATGSDRITARYMRENFFEFDPTHKIQLLTNYKPVIRGQDAGIWRRVMLVPFMAYFGDEEEIAEGKATHLLDKATGERIKDELPGVLAWIVQGAQEWFLKGLCPPDYILAANKDYQGEQDRIKHFVNENCELGSMFETPLTSEFGGLYPAYCRWCEESGIHPFAKQRFVKELERVVPKFLREDKKVQTTTKTRKLICVIKGIKLLED